MPKTYIRKGAVRAGKKVASRKVQALKQFAKGFGLGAGVGGVHVLGMRRGYKRGVKEGAAAGYRIGSRRKR